MRALQKTYKLTSCLHVPNEVGRLMLIVKLTSSGPNVLICVLLPDLATNESFNLMMAVDEKSPKSLESILREI